MSRLSINISAKNCYFRTCYVISAAILILGSVALYPFMRSALRQVCSQLRMSTQLSKPYSSSNIPPMFKREMIAIETKLPPGPTIRILQWNILAQGLSRENFTECPDEALSWEVRKTKLIAEITSQTPDVICLEEVDVFSYLDSQLSPLGYAGHFIPKPKSPCLMFSYNVGPDGCAMFYKTDKLDLLSNSNVNITVDGKQSNQVAILNSFISKPDNKLFSVLVTHLKAKDENHEMRFKQGGFLLDLLKQHIKSTKPQPIVWCGDFNADFNEPVYKLIQSSLLGVSSVYTKLSKDGSEPRYTTWKIRGEGDSRSEVARTIDYIWVSKARATVTAVLSIPSEDEVGQSGLPSWVYPSDHLAIACDVVLH